MDLESRIFGCFFGGAVGDALGAPVEFDSIERIRERFGPSGIQDFHDAYGICGAITDDTQMALFTAEGLMRAYVRGSTKGIVSTPGVVYRAYRRWLATQEGGGPVRDDGWLIGQRELHERRAPGNTCLNALRDGGSIGWSKGCGGVMRVAPTGLMCGRYGGDVFDLGCKLARITHGHPSGYLAAGGLACLIDAIMRDANLDEALDVVDVRLVDAGAEAAETAIAVGAARALAASRRRPSPAAVESLGEGWVAEEALAIAVYCALVAEDFAHGVRLAVNHSGDSDSTGAIAGNILGVMHGIQAIPDKWVNQVELADVIGELVGDWNDLFVGAVDPASKWRRYPGS